MVIAESGSLSDPDLNYKRSAAKRMISSGLDVCHACHLRQTPTVCPVWQHKLLVLHLTGYFPDGFALLLQSSFVKKLKKH